MNSHSLPKSFSKSDGKLAHIFTVCFQAIGGETNSDVIWYLKERPLEISRETFFEMFVFAVWVSGMRRKSAETFLNRAKNVGFDGGYSFTARQASEGWLGFLTTLHGSPCPPRAMAKWEAVRLVAQRLDQFENEDRFRQLFFGKVRISSLGKGDVQRLFSLRLPFVRFPNAQFIIRNMGGEAIKCDRWVNSFLEHFRISLNVLEDRIEKLGIPLGLFDLVLWAYCEKCVKKPKHFQHILEAYLEGHFKDE